MAPDDPVFRRAAAIQFSPNGVVERVIQSKGGREHGKRADRELVLSQDGNRDRVHAREMFLTGNRASPGAGPGKVGLQRLRFHDRSIGRALQLDPTQQGTGIDRVLKCQKRHPVCRAVQTTGTAAPVDPYPQPVSGTLESWRSGVLGRLSGQPGRDGPRATQARCPSQTARRHSRTDNAMLPSASGH